LVIDPGTDKIGTFLESVERREAGDQPVGPSGRLLSLVPREGGIELVELIRVSGLPFDQFSELLKGLTDDHVICMLGPPGQETVELTSEGRLVTESPS
jgi:hypothetical protein